MSSKSESPQRLDAQAFQEVLQQERTSAQSPQVPRMRRGGWLAQKLQAEVHWPRLRSRVKPSVGPASASTSASASAPWLTKKEVVFLVVLTLAYEGFLVYILRRMTGGLFWGALAVLSSPATFGWLFGKSLVAPGPTHEQPSASIAPPASSEGFQASAGVHMDDMLTSPTYRELPGNLWHDVL